MRIRDANNAHHLPRQAPNAYRVCSEQRSARGCSVQACEIHLFLNCSFRVVFVPSLSWLKDRSYTKPGAKKGVFRKYPAVAPAAAAPPSLLLLSFGPLPLTPAPAAAAAAASGSAMFMDMKNPLTEKSGKQSSSSSSFSSGLPVLPAALLCCATSMQRSRYLSAAAA